MVPDRRSPFFKFSQARANSILWPHNITAIHQVIADGREPFIDDGDNSSVIDVENRWQQTITRSIASSVINNMEFRM